MGASLWLCSVENHTKMVHNRSTGEQYCEAINTNDLNLAIEANTLKQCHRILNSFHSCNHFTPNNATHNCPPLMQPRLPTLFAVVPVAAALCAQSRCLEEEPRRGGGECGWRDLQSHDPDAVVAQQHGQRALLRACYRIQYPYSYINPPSYQPYPHIKLQSAWFVVCLRLSNTLLSTLSTLISTFWTSHVTKFDHSQNSCNALEEGGKGCPALRMTLWWSIIRVGSRYQVVVVVAGAKQKNRQTRNIQHTVASSQQEVLAFSWPRFLPSCPRMQESWSARQECYILLQDHKMLAVSSPRCVSRLPRFL